MEVVDTFNQTITDEPQDYQSLEFNSIQYNFPVERDGCKYIDILDATNDILTFKTPELSINQVIHKNENEKYIDLIIPADNKVFFEFIANIDDHNMLNIYNNTNLWFNKSIPLDVLDDFHRPVVKIKKSGVAVFRTSFTNDELNELVEGDSGYFIIKLDSIKLYKREFITNWIILKYEKPDTDYEFGENIIDNNNDFEFDVKEAISKIENNNLSNKNIDKTIDTNINTNELINNSKSLAQIYSESKKKYRINNNDDDVKSIISETSTVRRRRKRIIYANKEKIW